MPSQKTLDELGDWVILLQPDQNIDRRKCVRKVPMEVLSLGAPRTGTLSMASAYKILGIPSYHFASVVVNSRDADMWLEAMDAKYNPDSRRPAFTRRDFDQLLGHVGATTDAPTILFWQELIAAYPEAKVVLVERDEDKWLKSIRVLFSESLNPVGRYILRYTDPGRTGRILTLGFAWFGGWLGVKERDMTLDSLMVRARGVYRKHYADIRATVPPENLLEYKLGSGWAPLCGFLGKDIPEVPFPHVNDAKTLKAGFEQLIVGGLKRSAVNLAMFAGVGATIWQMYKVLR
ncbi:hypothetical protein B0A52_05920 [Exophiala mesophila]|uniref:Uncharacterized protein n=1 Tax=Exophiala mesophila TaxID=212818 RepID=A0A438N417_EXOME|nr:hypothetical protein B0A52_05920 [Exophiala mesophila]